MKVLKGRIFENSRKLIGSNIAVKTVGLSIGALFLIAGGLSLYLCIFKYNDSFSKIIRNPSISLSLLLAFSFILTSSINSTVVRFIHVICLLVVGFLALVESKFLVDIHGEFLIILSVMIMKSYGLVTKSFRKVLILSILCCFIARFIINFDQILISSISFLYYLILLMFFIFSYVIILEFQASKVADEASHICEQWTKEQVYNDIGKSVFSTFMHDYHIDHSLTYLDTVEEFLKDGDIGHAIRLLHEVKAVLKDDNDNIVRIKEKIRLSEKGKPEAIDACKVISDKVEYFKKTFNLTGDEFSFYSDVNTNYQINIIPIDFSGMLENLIKNAIEACDTNRNIKIKLRLDEYIATLTVLNSGDPIPWREKDGRVPLESFRVGRTTKKRGSGWGVFSIIKRVHANYGDIIVTSGSMGTKFTITLPVVKVQNERVTVQQL